MQLLRELERVLRAYGEVPRCTGIAGLGILLASFPRSGNTWLRFMLANLSRALGGHDVEVDFHTVGRYVPDIRRNPRLDGHILTPGYPLFLKTHFPWIRGFKQYPAVVIVRDPADTLVSYYRHLDEGAGKRLPPLDRFIRHWRYGAPAWRDWHRSWHGRHRVLVRYEGLLADPGTELKRLLDELDVAVPEAALSAAVASSSRDNMRRLQQSRGDPYLRNQDFRFVNRARSGTARNVLSESDIEYIHACTREVARMFGYDGSADIPVRR